MKKKRWSWMPFGFELKEARIMNNGKLVGLITLVGPDYEKRMDAVIDGLNRRLP